MHLSSMGSDEAHPQSLLGKDIVYGFVNFPLSNSRVRGHVIMGA
jgi:hypothetical protein